jgi:phytanoyl-CoA hydroxylase
MINPEQIQDFRNFGFLVVQGALHHSCVEILRRRIDALLNSDNSKHGTDDEWACRINTQSPGFKHIINCWKCDPVIAGVLTDSRLGKAIADLGGWSGARLSSDSLFWKPPGSDPVPFHQDSFRVRRFLTPSHFITCWIALDECDEELGPLQYAKASHRWLVNDAFPESYPDYQDSMRLAAKEAGIVEPEVATVLGGAGTCAFHDGLTWHGSAQNVSSTRPRRAMSVHFVTAEARFSAPPTSPLFGYYKRIDNDELDEKNFPIVWANYRSPTLDSSTHHVPSWFPEG